MFTKEVLNAALLLPPVLTAARCRLLVLEQLAIQAPRFQAALVATATSALEWIMVESCFLPPLSPQASPEHQ